MKLTDLATAGGCAAKYSAARLEELLRGFEPVEAENLLVPVCLSATHVALSSVRVEPTWMMLGQSAGVAAAMAAEGDVAVQQLPIGDLQQRLVAAGQVLELQAVAVQ